MNSSFVECFPLNLNWCFGMMLFSSITGVSCFSNNLSKIWTESETNRSIYDVTSWAGLLSFGSIMISAIFHWDKIYLRFCIRLNKAVMNTYSLYDSCCKILPLMLSKPAAFHEFRKMFIVRIICNGLKEGTGRFGFVTSFRQFVTIFWKSISLLGFGQYISEIFSECDHFFCICSY